MFRMIFFSSLILSALSLPVAAFAQTTDLAKEWDAHFATWLTISIVVWLTVTIPMIYFLFKYRRRNKDEEGAYIKGNAGLEAVWIIIPLIIIIFLGVQSWSLFLKYRNVPEGAFEVRVEAFQYGFEMIYPDGIRTINELRVPSGPVKVSLTSRDVIHNFAVPDFRVREDMIPGTTTYLWFNADKPGEYNVYCAELCGPGHSGMRAKIIVMEMEDFMSWFKAQGEGPAIPAEDRGAELVDDLGCLGCHSITGVKGMGPSYRGLYGSERKLSDGTTAIADEGYIRESILNPGAKVVEGFDPIMPEYNLSVEDLDFIITYIKTIK